MRMRFFLSVSQLTWLLLVVVVVIPANRFGTSATSVTTTTEQQQECSMQQDGTCLPLTTTTTDAAADTTTTTTSTTVTTKPEDDCPDMNETCDYWASLGECDANPKYMLHNCRKSCHVCHWTKSQITREVNQRLGVGTTADGKDGKKEEEEVVDLTETPYGVTQSTVSANKEEELKLQETIQNMTNYMEQIVFQDPGHAKVKKECKNRNKLCAYWALIGECDVNPTFMTLQCAPSCQTCHLIDFETRCPYNASQPTILNPGDLDKLFIRLTTDEYYLENYQATIHSMPNPPQQSLDASETKSNSTIRDGPWVVTLENFLSDEECDRLIHLGGQMGYEISKDVGPQKFDGSFEGYANERRTSTNAWCKDECFNDTLTQAVLQRIENVTGVPDVNSEYLQLLKYEVGQFYKTHHDYIAYQTTRQEGVRILTVFLYLNDVEAGGGTDFPGLGITVQPKRGRVLIWPSVLNEDPNAKDPRTDHQALPVEKGIKYGANAWLHQRDFKTVFDRGCH